MEAGSRFTTHDIDADMALDPKPCVLLLGRDDSARETVHLALESLVDEVDVVVFNDAQTFSINDNTNDIALVVIIASGDGKLDSHWASSLVERQTLAPVILVDTDNAGFDTPSAKIAWRHVGLKNHTELNSTLDSGIRIGHLRLALDNARERQSLMRAGIAAILNQNDTASAVLNDTTLAEPTPALAGLFGARSIDRVSGSDIRDWIKEADLPTFHDVLKHAQEESTAADAVVRIVTPDDVEYGLRISIAPPRWSGDETTTRTMNMVVASADNRFRPDLLAYSGHTQIGGRMALHNDLAAPRNQAKQAGYGLIAIQVDDLQAIEDNHGLAATEIFAHRLGLAIAEMLNERNRLYRTDTGRFVVFVERNTAESIKDLSESLQASLTDRRIDEYADTSATVTISVCHIELNEGAQTDWSHDDRLARVLRGVDALSRLGGNNVAHHGAVAAIEAYEAQLATEEESDAGHHGIETERAFDTPSGAGDESRESALEPVWGQEAPPPASNTHALQMVNDTDRDLSSIGSNAEKSEFEVTKRPANSSDLDLTNADATRDSDAGDTAAIDNPSTIESGTQVHELQGNLNEDPEALDQTPWTHALRQALEKDGFRLAYQGVTSLSGIGNPYFEVLLRYVDETGQLISAGEFLSDAERSGLMPRIDRWVTHQALHVISEQREAKKPIGLFVKLSPLLLPESRDFLNWLFKTADERRIERADIIFSFRESDINYYGKPMEALISELSQEGFRTALTHVSGKHSASILLSRVPFNFVKLSASFAHSFITNDDERPLHEMIEELQSHNVPFIADQIEDADAMAKLWQAGINYVQGYFIQEPDTKTFPE